MRASEREQESRIWTYIGKLSVVLTVIAAPIAIYQSCATTVPEIIATCFIREHERPSNSIKIDDPPIIDNKERELLIESLVDEEHLPEQWAVEAFSTRLEFLAKEKVAHELIRFSFRHNPDLICRIKNEGGKTASDVVLTLDQAPLRVERDGRPILDTDPIELRTRATGITQVSLGGLPPGVTTEVHAWMSSRLFYFSEILISHPDGTAEVEIHDLTLPSDSHTPIPMWPVWLGALGTAIIFSVWVLDVARKQRSMERRLEHQQADGVNGRKGEKRAPRKKSSQ